MTCRWRSRTSARIWRSRPATTTVDRCRRHRDASVRSSCHPDGCWYWGTTAPPRPTRCSTVAVGSGSLSAPGSSAPIGWSAGPSDSPTTDRAVSTPAPPIQHTGRVQSIDIDIPVELCDDIAHTDTGAQVFVLALEAAQVDDGSPLVLEGSARYMWRQLTAGP